MAKVQNNLRISLLLVFFLCDGVFRAFSFTSDRQNFWFTIPSCRLSVQRYSSRIAKNSFLSMGKNREAPRTRSECFISLWSENALSKPCRRSRVHSRSCGCRASSCCRERGRGTCGDRTQRASQRTSCGWRRSWPDGCRSRC